MGGFVSLGNLFVESDINVEPMSKQFNMLYLRGNQIVVDGDINMYVYDPGTNNANGFTSWITGLAAKIARNYRLGTVVIGTPSSVTSTVTDPMPSDDGGLGECGQIFFGGDVYINFISRNSTRKYKVFSAGDICYFDGNFEINGQPYGIDLVKYFLDTALEEGNYSSTVLTQFERTREFYYSETDEVYLMTTVMTRLRIRFCRVPVTQHISFGNKRKGADSCARRLHKQHYNENWARSAA